MRVTKNHLDANGYPHNPIKDYTPTIRDLHLFDQNGYDLCPLEQIYTKVNFGSVKKHRRHRNAIKSNWFVQKPVKEGAHLNHSLMFERKAYAGDALAQLKAWAKDLPLLHKIIAMRPKWGLDFSMDYADREGNSFEVLHWEWDSFDYEEVMAMKSKLEPKLMSIDWNEAANMLLKRKAEWHGLDFFGQSDYKCNFFGVPKEQFKMVLWE